MIFHEFRKKTPLAYGDRMQIYAMRRTSIHHFHQFDEKKLNLSHGATSNFYLFCRSVDFEHER